MQNGPLARYRSLVGEGCLSPDPAQLLAAEKLELLANRLARYEPPHKTDLFSFFTRNRGEIPQGLYMFGGVGRGKTMLMDLFFEAIPYPAKRRVHFHEFMGEVHELIARFRADQKGDPIPATAQAIAREAALLCFDELHVTDIADAMILGRLFKALFEAGVVMVATSNSPPWELYKDGLNRPLFEPFIEIIENRMEVLQLEAATDYRLEKLQGAQLYFTPAGKKAAKAMRATFLRLTGRRRGEAASIDIKGRKLAIPEAAMGVARFDFEDLCNQPLGPGDYLVIAHAYDILLIENVPILEQVHREQARRFITLIDTLYDNGVRLVLSADAEPGALYAMTRGAELFERTASRLIEMRSQEYLARARGEEVGLDAG
ncbi:MAG: AFG1 family ATPase [Proteobacteria bacterium]|nr:AFG1 family ATPase [Pseudomonadota bacterium]